MAEDEDSSGRSEQKRPARRPNLTALAGGIERVVEYQRPADKTQDWAETTLRKAELPNEPGRDAELPTKPGLYAPSAGSKLVLVSPPSGAQRSWYPPDPDTGHPWQLTLHEALLRLGYTRQSPEYLAAKLLSLLVRIPDEINNGNIDQAINAAIQVGILYQAGQNEQLARAFAKKRQGAMRSANSKREHSSEIKMNLAIWDRKLEEQGEHNDYKRAEA